MVLLPSPQSVELKLVALIKTSLGQLVANQFQVLPKAGLIPQ
jgi:hypothetical protein